MAVPGGVVSFVSPGAAFPKSRLSGCGASCFDFPATIIYGHTHGMLNPFIKTTIERHLDEDSGGSNAPVSGPFFGLASN
jgi:hypothetical protein